jgi:tRNA(Ile)-lysidine synthase
VTDAVRRFLAARGVAGPGVVGVSGGPDSVALLRALVAAGAGPVAVAHVNHRLRGSESDADEAFVRDLAAGLGLPCHVLRLDPGSLAGNREAAARRARYDWFATLGGSWVATGHTADDQAETVLHRLVRGTGVQGLRGIAAVRRGPVPVVRPLLGVGRADVLAYLADLGQPYRTDATNADPGLTRNRIRHDLLPLLRTFNPAVAAALGRLAGQAEELFEYVAGEADRLLAAAELPRAGDAIVIRLATWAAAPPVLAAEAARRLWGREGWPAGEMTARHWRRAADLAPGDYPGGVTVRRAERVARLARLS